MPKKKDNNFDPTKFLDVIDDANVLFLGPNASMKNSSVFNAKNIMSDEKPFGSDLTKKLKKSRELDF